MNKLIPASLALASVQAVQEFSLTEFSPDSADLLQLSTEIGNGYCQVFAEWDFFDLKAFDALGRDQTKS